MIRIFISIFCLTLLTASTLAGLGRRIPPPVQNRIKPIDEKFHKFWKRRVLDGLLQRDYDAWFRSFVRSPTQLEKTFGARLPCPSLKLRTLPTSVHRLTPGDVKIVAALGGSATSGFGARSSSLADLFVDFRGISWSIGGDGSLESVLTLPNILKKYNPLLTGYSRKATPVSDRNKKSVGYNFAKTGLLLILLLLVNAGWVWHVGCYPSDVGLWYYRSFRQSFL